MIIPLFPLPVALYPGAVQLLHIFEHRYRQMVKDCLGGDKRFGLLCVPEDQQAKNVPPQPGDVGCQATIRSHQHLPDGRSNIQVVGEVRFTVMRTEPGKAYFLGAVEPFGDAPEDDEELTTLAEQARQAFFEWREAHRLATAESEAWTPSRDPKTLSFELATATEADLSLKLEWLRGTSTADRLRSVQLTLEQLAAQVRFQMSARELAKRNGRGDHRVTLTDGS